MKNLRKDAQRFRKEKIDEVYSKPPQEIKDVELFTIKSWINHYGKEII